MASIAARTDAADLRRPLLLMITDLIITHFSRDGSVPGPFPASVVTTISTRTGGVAAQLLILSATRREDAGAAILPDICSLTPAGQHAILSCVSGSVAAP
jgi:hypothetical protein